MATAWLLVLFLFIACARWHHIVSLSFLPHKSLIAVFVLCIWAAPHKLIAVLNPKCTTQVDLCLLIQNAPYRLFAIFVFVAAAQVDCFFLPPMPSVAYIYCSFSLHSFVQLMMTLPANCNSVVTLPLQLWQVSWVIIFWYSYKTASVPQQLTRQPCNLPWFQVDWLEISSWLKPVYLVIITFCTSNIIMKYNSFYDFLILKLYNTKKYLGHGDFFDQEVSDWKIDFLGKKWEKEQCSIDQLIIVKIKMSLDSTANSLSYVVCIDCKISPYFHSAFKVWDFCVPAMGQLLQVDYSLKSINWLARKSSASDHILSDVWGHFTYT